MKNCNIVMSIIIFSLALLLDFYIFTEVPQLVVITLIKVALIVLALTKIGDKIKMIFKRVTPICTNREAEYLQPIINEIVDNVCLNYGRESFNMYLHKIKTTEIKSFSIGQNIVVISTGAINQLTEDELKALITHEVGRILNGDNIFKTVFCFSNIITLSLLMVYKLKTTIFDSDKKTENVLLAIFVLFLALFVYGLNSYKFLCQVKADDNVQKIGYKSELLEYLYTIKNISNKYEIKLIENRIRRLEVA